MLRIFVGTMLAALLVAGVLGLATAEEPKPVLSEAGVARLAHGLLQEEGALLDKALAKTAALDVATLRRVVVEMRSQVKIRGVLDGKRVKGLKWEQSNLDQVVAYLRTITGLNFYITPRVRADQYDSILITLSLDSVSISHVLRHVTEPYDLAWVPQNGVVCILTAEDLAVEPENSEPGPGAQDAAFRAKIAATRVNLNVEDEKFVDVVKLLMLQTGCDCVIDPRIASDVKEVLIKGMLFEDIGFDTCLNMLQAAAGDDVVWTTKGNVIVFTRRKLVDR